MRTTKSSRNWLAYTVLVSMAFTASFLISGSTDAVAEGSGAGGIMPDTVPVGGGSDTTGHGSSVDSGGSSRSLLDLLFLLLDTALLTI